MKNSGMAERSAFAATSLEGGSAGSWCGASFGTSARLQQCG
jgi:hypothetical protein